MDGGGKVGKENLSRLVMVRNHARQPFETSPAEAPPPMPAKRAFVYILRCSDKTLYIGTARDVAARLKQHNARKGAKYTKPRLPVRLVYREGPMSLTKALQREYQRSEEHTSELQSPDHLVCRL